jgi:hypothetical protein
MHNLTKNVRIDPAFINYAAGSTFQYSVVFDMQGYEGIAGILNLGEVTTGAACPFYAEGSTASNGTFVSFYGSTAAFTVAGASGDIWLISAVYRPNKRYVRFVAGRVTANTVINGGLALRYRADELPVAESTSIAGTGWVQDYALAVNATSS